MATYRIKRVDGSFTITRAAPDRPIPVFGLMEPDKKEYPEDDSIHGYWESGCPS